MKVEQFLNRNQFRLYDTNIDILQSYNSKVVEIKGSENNKTIKLGRDWDYSTTTSKHIYAFIREYAYCNRDMDGDKIGYILEITKNKRKYIQTLIEGMSK